MGYFYRDQHVILHVTDNKVIAEQFAVGQIVELEGVDHSGGYPQYDGKAIVDYGNGEVYWGGNKKDGFALSELNETLASDIQAILDKIGI